MQALGTGFQGAIHTPSQPQRARIFLTSKETADHGKGEDHLAELFGSTPVG